MKRLSIIWVAVLILLCTNQVFAQTDIPLDLPPIPVPERVESGRMDFNARMIYEFTLRNPDNERGLMKFADRMGILHKGDLMYGTIMNRYLGETPVNPEIVTRAGGEVLSVIRHMSSIRIPAASLGNLAASLGGNFFFEIGCPSNYNDFQGPRDSVTNSISYKTNGADGVGKSVAIIDNFYWNLNAAQIIPGTVDSINLNPSSGGFLDTLNTNPHGGACFARVFDHAPGARYYLFHAPGVGHKVQAFDSAISLGVDVISLSQSSNTSGYTDGTGWFCEAAKKAADAGILIFCSSGNKANGHWQGNFKDSDNDNWHEWANGLNELNTLSLSGAVGQRPQSVAVALQWEITQPDDSNAYRLDLMRWQNNQWVFQASDITGPDGWERTVRYTQQDSSVTDLLGIAVQNIGPTAPKLEIIVAMPLSQNIAINQPTGSTTSPTNTNHDRIISIGGVDWDQYAGGNGTSGIITNYSSQGPTNGGSPAPRMVGPTRTGSSPTRGFVGTSCSTPESAGVALALWSSVPSYNEAGVRYLLRTLASMYKDWGAPGRDNVYGYGGINLLDWVDKRVWVDSRNSANPNGASTSPYSTVRHGCNGVQNGGQVLFLGQGYDQLIPYLTTGSKQYSIRTAPLYDARLGYP